MGWKAQNALPVGDPHEAGAHIGENRDPQRRGADDGEHKWHDFEIERAGDALPEDLNGIGGDADGFGDLAGVIVHQRDVAGLDRSVGPCSAHSSLTPTLWAVAFAVRC